MFFTTCTLYPFSPVPVRHTLGINISVRRKIYAKTGNARRHGTQRNRGRGGIPPHPAAPEGAAPVHRFHKRVPAGQRIRQGHPVYRPMEKVDRLDRGALAGGQRAADPRQGFDHGAEYLRRAVQNRRLQGQARHRKIRHPERVGQEAEGFCGGGKLDSLP